MNTQGEHLVFFDGQCGLCDRVVQGLLRVDKEKKFVFAPLQGETARQFLHTLPDHAKRADSLILIENYRGPHPQIVLFARGAFRIAWLLGKWWRLLGWMSFLPSFLSDWAYRLVARNRHRFFPKDVCRLPDSTEKDRFLP